MKELVETKDFFKNYDKSSIIDPLTNTILRAPAVDYVKNLIKNNVPFYFGILDIDNFKSINDSYGHSVGDEVLSKMASNIMNALDNTVMVARYGGDEFLILFEGIEDYDTVWGKIKSLYKFGARVPIILNNWTELAITSTSGFANFPKDGKDFDELFRKCDICLYRGKMKGRNCFIIYVDNLHANLNLNNKVTLSNRIKYLYDIFYNSKPEVRVNKLMSYLTSSIGCTGVSFSLDGKIIDSYVSKVDKKHLPVVPEKCFEDLYVEDMIKINSVDDITIDHPTLEAYFKEIGISSFVVLKVVYEQRSGYLVMYEDSFRRIWQDDDISLFIILSNMLKTLMYMKEK